MPVSRRDIFKAASVAAAALPGTAAPAPTEGRQQRFGYISLEMEGNEPADTAVPKSLALLKAAFA